MNRNLSDHLSYFQYVATFRDIKFYALCRAVDGDGLDDGKKDFAKGVVESFNDVYPGNIFRINSTESRDINPKKGADTHWISTELSFDIRFCSEHTTKRWSDALSVSGVGYSVDTQQ